MFLVFEFKDSEVAFVESADERPLGDQSVLVVYEYTSKTDPGVIKLATRFGITDDKIKG